MAATLDPAEIEKFSALAAEWWNPKGPFGALHRLNPVRLQYIRDQALRHFSSPSRAASSPVYGGGRERSEQEGESPSNAGAAPSVTALRALTAPAQAGEQLAQRRSPASGGASRAPLAGLSVLDLGCGGGLVSAPLARMGGAVTAIDASAEAIGAASAYAAQAGLAIDFRNTTAEALVEAGETFDLVAALEIIEHVADVSAFLSAAQALVKPGGLIVLSTINRTPKARALAIVGAERILKWAPEGAHDYDKLVTPDEIRAGAPEIRWGEPAGVVYNPLGKGWTLSRDTDVNYLIAGTKRP